MRKTLLPLLALCVGMLSLHTQAQTSKAPKRPECIAPAQPGGGFDLTCRLAQSGLKESKALSSPLRIVYMPGGIGAVAYNNIVAKRPNDGGAIVAFSGGSLLNLAQGKFGQYNVNDVRWLASVGADYGAALVHEDSPFKTLDDLMQALKKDPASVVFGAGGTVGSQDWMKAALTAQAAGVDFRRMRFVAFEGGGEGITALRGGHVQAYMGDAAEAVSILEGGTPVRVLAVYHNERLPGRLADVPTAKEQGYDIEWPIVRGFYMGPKVSDEQYQWWVDAFERTMSTPEFEKLQTQQGLFPLKLTGQALDDFVKERVRHYEKLAESFGLLKK